MKILFFALLGLIIVPLSTSFEAASIVPAAKERDCRNLDGSSC